MQENAYENVIWKIAAIFLGLNVLTALLTASQPFPLFLWTDGL